MNVTIIGAGYVGLTTGAALAYFGNRVTCLDVDEPKIEALREGKAPIYEPFLEHLMALSRENLVYTTSYPEAIPGADIIFIAVGTPSGPSGGPDLKYLRAAAEELSTRHPEFRLEGYDGKSSGYVVDTLRTVFDAFFSTDDFEDCVVKTVNRGGDADTTGSIAGAIAGARYGLAAIPRRWLKVIDGGLREELLTLAGKLVLKSPLFAGTPPRSAKRSQP